MLKPYQRIAVANDVRHLTMVCNEGVEFTAEEAVWAVQNEIPGDLVECGVWKGGCGIAMLLAQREVFGEVRRPVHFLDSFAGLPPAEPRDGPAALRWQAENPDNCAASMEELIVALKGFGFVDGEFVIRDGSFKDTLPVLANRVKSIALLRLDCDWYNSVMLCLEELMPMVSNGATVIVDDYYAWDGCARAVHDYLSGNDLPYRMRSIDLDASGAYFQVPS